MAGFWKPTTSQAAPTEGLLTTTEQASRIRDSLQDGLANLQARGDGVNEANTRDVLINLVLDGLGYPPTHRSSEQSERDNRPDYLCYLGTVDTQAGYPALVVEAKRLNADFDRAPSGLARAYSPDRQIQRYLASDRISRPNTIGVLTDGIRWRVYQRGPASTDVEHLESFSFWSIANSSQTTLDAKEEADSLERFIQLLSSKAIAGKLLPDTRQERRNSADRLFEMLQATTEPAAVLKQILNEQGAVVSSRLENVNVLPSIRRDAHDKDWERYAVALGPEFQTDTPDFEGNHIPVAAVEFRYQGGEKMSRGDVALCARTVASSSNTNAAAVFAYETAPDGSMVARMAVSAGSQVSMTALFDPALPSPSARTSIDQQLRLIRDASGPLNADGLLAPFTVANLRQQFYREVADWTALTQAGKDQRGREAVLRHLIRVMFAWILKEENRIPPEIFEPGFIASSLGKTIDDYHDTVLRFLFHHRLNVRPDERDTHTNATINDALERAPFLNGSLFAEQDGDDALKLQASDYWSVDEKYPGLFTILSRYHWTMDEHRPGESEQTLDPELLSNLFERLIASTEEDGEESLMRQPQGTYYTPADVTDEMVKDALTAAVKEDAGALTETQLLDLFGDSDSDLPELEQADKQRLAERIRELHIFDPAVGSGAFLFSTLLAVRRAIRKLEDVKEPAEDIIKRQLRGQDINPLAVQIARLRLFIAIVWARKDSVGPLTVEDEALPNLEAVIICADTLETVADHEWRLAQLDMADADIGEAIAEIGANRVSWFDAHMESEKRELQNKDKELRALLEGLLQGKGELASAELRQFASTDLLSHEPARTDARLLFYESPWRGFDVVIGNPPYEALGKSMTADDRNRLAEDKLYQTIKGGDLYNLFCETALALAKPQGGVVTLITPLSIAFGQNKQVLRDIFVQRSSAIALRHYNNRPDTIFNTSPTVKSPENRQRATILTAILGDSKIKRLETTGLQSWAVEERLSCLRDRTTTPMVNPAGGMDSRVWGQWLRTTTKETTNLLAAISRQSKTIQDFKYPGKGGSALAFPETAYRYLSAIPANSVSPRRENILWLQNKETLYIVMAALNSHVGYGWWWMVGDGFHIKAVSDLGLLKIPDKWSDSPGEAIALGKQLVDAIPYCITEWKQGNKVWRNVDFHTHVPDLIAKIDRLYIEALELDVEPLLTHLKIMRSSSSWDYSQTL